MDQAKTEKNKHKKKIQTTKELTVTTMSYGALFWNRHGGIGFT